MESEIDWSKIVKLDVDSPSGLAWNFDLIKSNGAAHHLVKVGNLAGSQNSKSKKWTFIYAGKNYMCHRVIYRLRYGHIEEGFVIDHLDGDPSNNTYENLRMKTIAQNSRNMKKSEKNTSGVTGVFFEVKRNSTFAIAKWRDLDSKPFTKLYRVQKYGLLPAFKMAVEYRNYAISELNKKGAQYTERHGT